MANVPGTGYTNQSVFLDWNLLENSNISPWFGTFVLDYVDGGNSSANVGILNAPTRDGNILPWYLVQGSQFLYPADNNPTPTPVNEDRIVPKWFNSRGQFNLSFPYQTVQIAESISSPTGLTYFSRVGYVSFSPISYIGTYNLHRHGRPGERSILSLEVSSPDINGNLTVLNNAQSSLSSGIINVPIGQSSYNITRYFNILITNLPVVIPVTPETPAPAPAPVPPMESVPPAPVMPPAGSPQPPVLNPDPTVPPVVPPPPPAPTPPPPTEDMAVPRPPVVPRPIAVVDSTPGLAPNVPVVIRDFTGSPTMPLTMPRRIPNPYGGGSGSGNRNVARNITPRTGPQPVGG